MACLPADSAQTNARSQGLGFDMEKTRGAKPAAWRFSALVIALAWAGPAGGVEVNPPLATGSLVIAGRVNLTVEVARTSAEQIRGLSGRPDLKPGHGMLFVYNQPRPVSIWMKDMRFPLDILWIRDSRIVKIEKQVPPLDPQGPERTYTATADLVLEVPAGFTDHRRIRVGDTVRTSLP